MDIRCTVAIRNSSKLQCDFPDDDHQGLRCVGVGVKSDVIYNKVFTVMGRGCKRHALLQ
jgi:hypothetical protein